VLWTVAAVISIPLGWVASRIALAILNGPSTY
jgi:hypothetical protein